MSRVLLDPQTTVAEALAGARAASNVFLAHRTACVGCSLARFCSLRDVATAYKLSLQSLLIELENAAPIDALQTKGVRHEKYE